MKVTISGFYDEVSLRLDKQIELLNELGEKYMCPRMLDGKNIADYTVEEFVTNVKPRLDAYGIKFSSIGSPIGKVDINDEAGFEKQLTQLAELVKICEVMDCKYIRMFSFFMPKNCDPQKYRDKVLEKLSKYLEVVEGSPVVLLHENEKEIYGDVYERCLDLYQTINHPQFKLIYDASNFIQVGCNPNVAYEAVKEYVVYYHMKDCDAETGVEMPLGLGFTDYKSIFKDLEARGFEGFMTMEPHTQKYALGRRVMGFLPFLKFVKPDFYKGFRKIDKKLGVSLLKKITPKDVFVMQYENLKKFIEEAGK